MPVFDLILVGGGIANVFLAAQLRRYHPGLSLLVLERKAELGIGQTWCFHASDLCPATDWLRSWASHQWSGYDVFFPGLRRQFTSDYFALTDRHFAKQAKLILGQSLRLESKVHDFNSRYVELDDGTVLSARQVIDGRGLTAAPDFAHGTQRFFGLRVKLRKSHSLQRPILMDACVPQQQGYRFVYVLPFAADELLLEDTFYTSEHPDKAESHRFLCSYADSRGWEIADILSEEEGALPIPLLGAKSPALNAKMPTIGVRAGLFHAVTGYSIAVAAHLATTLAARPDFMTADLHKICQNYALKHWRSQSYLRRLNNMMFKAATPSERIQIFKRFHGFDTALIERFYAGRLHPWDKVRLLAGKPPVALGAGFNAFIRHSGGTAC